MMPEDTTSTNSKQAEAEKLAQLLELELIQKRAAWKQVGARRQNVRIMSFAFLFLIIAGCLVGLFVAFSMINGERPKQGNSPASASDEP
jgi:hypothetical protein